MPTLPREALDARLTEETRAARRSGLYHYRVPRAPFEYPLALNVTLLGTPAAEWDGREVRDRFVHKLTLRVTEEYPYVRPTVEWETPIFHPNIMLPEDGGYACTRLLTSWRFDHTLDDFLTALAHLVSHPDVENPYATASCAAAAKYFSKAPFRVPPVAPGRAE